MPLKQITNKAKKYELRTNKEFKRNRKRFI